MEPLRNRELDAFAQQLDEYKESVRHTDANRGVGGPSMPERVEKIKSLVRHVVELAPPRAQGAPIDIANATGNELMKYLQESREAVMPRRRQHEPQFRYSIIPESTEHIAFLREFSAQWKGPNLGYQNQYFPNLAHAGHYAQKLVTLYDALDKIQNYVNRGAFSDPLSVQDRRHLYDYVSNFSERGLAQWPDLIPNDGAKRYLPPDDLERYNIMANRVHYHLMALPGLCHPDRADSVGQIHRTISDMRYEVCSAAQRGFKEINFAYDADSRAMAGNPKLQDASDPVRQHLPMLDRVYHARWALMADAMAGTVKTNRPMLEKFGVLRKQTHAEAQEERAQAGTLDKNGQGILL